MSKEIGIVISVNDNFSSTINKMAQANEFIDRENSEGRTVFLIGSTCYGIIPVDKEDCLF